MKTETEKEFVPYKEAVALKELGFDNFTCLGVHYCDGSEFELKSCETQYYAQKGLQNGILAPTYSQAFRWFREKYGLTISIKPNKHSEIGIYWGAWIRSFNESDVDNKEYIWFNENESLDSTFYTYEKAQLGCLRKLIEIVKDAES